MRDVSRSVGERVLFSGISLRVMPGQIVVVYGPSGAGKSLLLRALAGLDPLQSGEVLLDGRPQQDWPMPQWRAQVCLVPQRTPALPGTPAQLAEEVASYHSHSDPGADPRDLAERFALPPSAFDQPWSQLSGGERQRATLSIALSHRPRVLLLDEPTAALDPESVELVESALAGTTAIWVTHDPAQRQRVGDAALQLG